MKGWGNKKSQSNSNKNIPPPQQRKPIPSTNLTLNINQKPQKYLTPQQQLHHLKHQLADKQTLLHSKQKLYRIELFKNGKIKEDIQQVDKEFELNKIKITLDLLQKNKNNKDSPLFYNQNGLSPLEITLVNQKKHQNLMNQSFICMICFQDIEQNQIIIQLPCGDCFHKDCAIQHMLGSKFCPNCSEVIDLAGHSQKKLPKQERKSSIFSIN